VKTVDGEVVRHSLA